MSVWNKDWRYVPSKDQGPDYLKNKFRRIRAEQKAKEEKTREIVRPIKQAQGGK
jgi:hypothetical protein